MSSLYTRKKARTASNPPSGQVSVDIEPRESDVRGLGVGSPLQALSGFRSGSVALSAGAETTLSAVPSVLQETSSVINSNASTGTIVSRTASGTNQYSRRSRKPIQTSSIFGNNNTTEQNNTTTVSTSNNITTVINQNGLVAAPVLGEDSITVPASHNNTDTIPTMDTLKQVYSWTPTLFTLQTEKYNFSEFRSLQLETLNSQLLGHDTVLTVPTGSGKSLIYQMAAHYYQTCRVLDSSQTSLIVVITPMIALMDDQVREATRYGLRAACMHSDNGILHAEIKAQQNSNNLDQLFVAPERLIHNNAVSHFGSYILGLPLKVQVVDEAHQSVSWGTESEFRSAYRNIGVQHKAGVPKLALTATAGEETIHMIEKQLKMTQPVILQGASLRDNLIYRCAPRQTNDYDVLGLSDFVSFFRKLPVEQRCGLIYFPTRKLAETGARYLNERNGSTVAVVYHGNLAITEKQKNTDAWLRDQVPILCATSAFGIGINKPNVRYVWHYGYPMSLEDYVQESGRAGRDGLASHVIISFKLNDLIVYLRKQTQAQLTKEQQESKIIHLAPIPQKHIQDVQKYCLNKQNCRRQVLAQHFQTDMKPCQVCDVCVSQNEEQRKDVSRFLCFLFAGITKICKTGLAFCTTTNLAAAVLHRDATYIGDKKWEIPDKWTRASNIQEVANLNVDFIELLLSHMVSIQHIIPSVCIVHGEDKKYIVWSSTDKGMEWFKKVRTAPIPFSIYIPMMYIPTKQKLTQPVDTQIGSDLTQMLNRRHQITRFPANSQDHDIETDSIVSASTSLANSQLTQYLQVEPRKSVEKIILPNILQNTQQPNVSITNTEDSMMVDITSTTIKLDHSIHLTNHSEISSLVIEPLPPRNTIPKHHTALPQAQTQHISQPITSHITQSQHITQAQHTVLSQAVMTQQPTAYLPTQPKDVKVQPWVDLTAFFKK